MRIRTRPRAKKIAACSRTSPPLERKFAARRRSRRRERENLRGRKENPRIERRTPRRANRRNRRLEPDGFPALVRAGAAVVLPTSMRTSQTTLPDSAPTSSHPPSRRATRSLALVRAGGSRRRGLEGGRKARGGGALRDRVRGAVRGGGASSRASHRHVHQGGRRRGDQVGPARAEAREAGSVRGKVHAVREQSLGGRREQVRRARPRALPPRVARVRSRGGTPLRCVPSFVVRVFFLADALARARLRGSIAHARAPLRDPPPTRTRPLTSSPRPSSPRRSNQDASPVETQRAQEEAVQRDARRDDPTQRHDPRPALGG